MEGETITEKKTSEVAIALIQRDMEYIKKSIGGIEDTLKIFDRNFVRKEELKEIEKLIEKNFLFYKEELAKKIDVTDFNFYKNELGKKVNSVDFTPFKRTMDRVNWLIISAVVLAVLALVFKVHITA